MGFHLSWMMSRQRLPSWKTGGAGGVSGGVERMREGAIRVPSLGLSCARAQRPLLPEPSSRTVGVEHLRDELDARRLLGVLVGELQPDLVDATCGRGWGEGWSRGARV